ncbi:MAG TPA: indole-3-glycerol phosphate synthase TrpC [Gemmatales bacterium]|nr:indole-3-glycerol phosphate synthase TrpC [Gemmatales bacterium]HMP17776.1 indole-3-glycerol phosphate synthase TrpC [Gemmatales bacterium]
MATILDAIVQSKRKELEAARKEVPETDLLQALDRLTATASQSAQRFHQALLETPYIRIIAEVKRQSPSAGKISAQADAVQVAREYSQHGAACISVLTDEPHFGGNLQDLRRVRAAVRTPLLRKDFILDRYQVLEAKLAGADAVLLIAEILEDAQMASLLREIEHWGMTALVECYEASNVSRVLDAGATVVGINNRNLHTFEVKLEHTLELANQIPASITLVSESGIRTRADVEKLATAGIQAILVGETLMKAPSLPLTMQDLGTVPRQSRTSNQQ